MRDEEDNTSASTNLSCDENDVESVNKSETVKVFEEEILRLLHSDTNEDDFSGFSVQEEGDDGDY